MDIEEVRTFLTIAETGPLAFATLVAATGRFDLGFLVAALAGLVGFWLLRSGIRSSSIAQP